MLPRGPVKSKYPAWSQQTLFKCGARLSRHDEVVLTESASAASATTLLLHKYNPPHLFSLHPSLISLSLFSLLFSSLSLSLFLSLSLSLLSSSLLFSLCSLSLSSLLSLSLFLFFSLSPSLSLHCSIGFF